MKYGRLKKHKEKEDKLNRWSLTLMMPACFIAVICAFGIALEIADLLVALRVLILAVIFMIISLYLGKQASKYTDYQDEYIVLKIMDLITKEGISADDFCIISESKDTYKIGFHNQNINYDDLQEKINNELYEMNKIIDRDVRFELI